MSRTTPQSSQEDRGRWLMSLTALAIQLSPRPASNAAPEVGSGAGRSSRTAGRPGSSEQSQ